MPPSASRNWRPQARLRKHAGRNAFWGRRIRGISARPHVRAAVFVDIDARLIGAVSRTRDTDVRVWEWGDRATVTLNGFFTKVPNSTI